MWKNRPLERRCAYIWLDAIYTKILTDGKDDSTAVLMAIGLKEDGQHYDILVLHMGNV